MVYLAMQILVWLVCAFFLGAIVGWWMKKKLVVSKVTTESQTQSATADCGHAAEITGLQKQVADKQSTIDDLQNQIMATPEITASKPKAKKTPISQPIISDAPDDLKRIFGIGKVIENKLHTIGITKFEQVAKFTSTDVVQVAEKLDTFKDRIDRDNWISGAKQCHYEKYGEKL